MTNIKKIVPLKPREINIDNMQIKFRVGKTFMGKLIPTKLKKLHQNQLYNLMILTEI